MNAAMIISKNQYFNGYFASFGCENGQTMDFYFDSRKEAAQMIKDMGFELMTKRAFNDEMYLRAHIYRAQRDMDYSFASNG